MRSFEQKICNLFPAVSLGWNRPKYVWHSRKFLERIFQKILKSEKNAFIIIDIFLIYLFLHKCTYYLMFFSNFKIYY